MTPTGSPTHYQVLGIDPQARPSVIKAAYKALIKDLHPDRPDGDAVEFGRVTLAFETLSDEQRRRRYDETLVAEPVSVRTDADSPFVDADIVDEPWGTETPMGAPIPTDPSTGVAAAGQWRPVSRRTFWPMWRVLTVVALVAGAFVLAEYVAVGWGAAAVSAVMLVSALRRTFADGARRALYLGIGLIGIATVFPNRGDLLFPYGTLAIAVALFGAGELSRRAIQGHRSALRRQDLVATWDTMTAAASRKGAQLLWVQNSQPHGAKTTVLVRDALGENVQRSLWGRIPAKVWVVVDRAGAVQEMCGDDARRAWEAARGSRP